MDKTDEQLATLIEKLQKAGFAQAPEVIEGTIRAIQWDGYMQIAIVVLFFLLFTGSILLTIFAMRTERDYDDVGVAGMLGAAFVSIPLLIASAAGNPWLKAFDPEASFYQQLIERIL